MRAPSRAQTAIIEGGRRTTARFVLSVAVTAAALCVPFQASAQTDNGKVAAGKHFELGAAAYAKKDYRTAAAEFMAAWRLLPHGAAIYNAGLAYEASGDGPRAADAFYTALRQGGMESEEERDARLRLAELETKLVVVEASARSGTRISLAHVSDVAVPAQVHVRPGEYEATASCPDGKVAVRPLTASKRVVQLTFDECDATAPARAVREQQRDSVASDEESSGRATWGWGAIAFAGALSGGAIVLGMKALDARQEFEDSGETDRDAHDRAASYRLWTNVLWGGAVVAGGAGVYLVLTGNESKSGARSDTAHRPRGTVAVGPGAVSFRWRF